MRIKFVRFLLLFLISMGIMTINRPVYAQNENLNVLIVYSVEENNALQEVRILDTLVGQFTKQITLLEDKELDTTDLNQYRHVIYYGGIKKEIPVSFEQALNLYRGNLFVIGHNVEQFKKHFPSLRIKGEVLVNRMEVVDPSIVTELPEERIVYELDQKEKNGIIGYDAEGNPLPLIAKSNGNFYFAGQTLYNPFGKALSESFYDFFQLKKEKKTTLFLRLEDIHPKSDPVLLRKQAEFLKDKGIPYMVAVIPVYVNGSEELHYSDSPELVRTLQYMQKNGASIVLHGYKHQYRVSETGEGFEFWDVENDRPIYQNKEDKVSFREDFNTEEEYLTYVANGEAFEKSYIEQTLTQGTHELVAHKLYPLAFEAPHYAMSQQGYCLLSNHFTAYVGRVQLTDQTWESEYTSVYQSQPAFLNGITLYPETLGYVEGTTDQSIEEIRTRINQNKFYTQSNLSVFYHPYLGLDGLKSLVKALEEVDNASWFDLKEVDNTVQVDQVTIESKDGEVKVKKAFVSSDYEKELKLFAGMEWLGIGAIVAIPLLLIRYLNKRKVS